jgi:hypothetical protein
MGPGRTVAGTGTDDRDVPTLRRAGPLLLFVIGDIPDAGTHTPVGVAAGEACGCALARAAGGLALPMATSYVELITRFPCAGGAAAFAGDHLAAGVPGGGGEHRAAVGHLPQLVATPAVPPAP